MPRPRKDPEEVMITLGVSVLPSVEDEIQTIANDEERTKSWIAGKLLLRGLVAYRADGKLTVEEAPKRATRTTSSKPLKLSRRAIREALDNGRGLYGEPLSEKDRQTIEKLLVEEGDDGSARHEAKPRKRAKKS